MGLSRKLLKILFVYLTFLPTISSHTVGRKASIWSGWGGNIFNNRYASTNDNINSRSIRPLSTHCQQQYPRGVSATPVISGNIAYYPTWDGLLVALDYTTCKEKWGINVTTIIVNNVPSTSVPKIAAVVQPLSRTSPQIDSEYGVLYFATLRYALVVALDLKTGETLGAANVNPHPAAAITQSPTFHDGTLFIGSSSSESAATARVPGYQCCTLVGNFAALTFNRRSLKFRVQWDIPMIPKERSGLDK